MFFIILCPEDILSNGFFIIVSKLTEFHLRAFLVDVKTILRFGMVLSRFTLRISENRLNGHISTYQAHSERGTCCI